MDLLIGVTEIRGTVTGPDGAKIAEASVYFLEGPVPLPDIAQLTDGEGGFQLTAPVPGTYRIGVRAPGFEPAEVTVEVRGEPEVRVEVRLPDLPIDLPFQPPSRTTVTRPRPPALGEKSSTSGRPLPSRSST